MSGSIKSRAASALIHLLASRGYTLNRARFHEEHDLDVRALLAEPIERAQGRFVVLQIGANDGVANDPIHDAVATRGWELYAVEPMPAVFAKLEQTYAGNPLVHCLPCAVGDSDGQAEIFFIRQEVPPSAVEGQPQYDQYTSFSREVVEQHWRAIPDLKNRIETTFVPVVTLTTLIHTYNIPQIDMLQIDTEGFDWEIIKMAFAAGLVPPILAFEWVNMTQQEMWDCRCTLIEHGYRWILNKGDVIASRTTTTHPLVH